jgi:hypothetical protein
MRLEPFRAARFFWPLSRLARMDGRSKIHQTNDEPLPAATQPSQREAEAETIRGRQRRGDLPGRQHVDRGKRTGQIRRFM